MEFFLTAVFILMGVYAAAGFACGLYWAIESIHNVWKIPDRADFLNAGTIAMMILGCLVIGVGFGPPVMLSMAWDYLVIKYGQLLNQLKNGR